MFGTLNVVELALVLAMIAGCLVVIAFPAGRICRRLGYPAWLGILAVVPVVNVGLLWFVAFATWPGRSEPASR